MTNARLVWVEGGDVAEVGNGGVYSCSFTSRGSTARGSARWERGGHGVELEALLESFGGGEKRARNKKRAAFGAAISVWRSEEEGG